MEYKNKIPVVILHMEIMGLCIARDLSDKGVEIYGLDERRRFGTFSKYIRFRKIIDHQKNPEKFKNQLISLGRQLKNKAILISTADRDFPVLLKYQKELNPYYFWPYEKKTINQIMDKWNLIEIAKKYKIPAPKTYLIRNQKDIDDIKDKLDFPVIIKPRRSIDWNKKFSKKTNIYKVVKAYSIENLDKLYRRIKKFNQELLIQDYIPGKDSQIRVFASIFDGKKDLVSFVGHKLLHYPEGITAIVEIEENEEIKKLASRLLKEIKYSGISEVEFKTDPRTGKHFLIEINPRFWNWHQLGRINGINLSWLYYQYILGNKLTFKKRKEKVKWVDDTRILLLKEDILFRRSKITYKKLKKYLKGKNKKAVFSLKDPLPFLAFLIITIKDIIKRRFN